MTCVARQIWTLELVIAELRQLQAGGETMTYAGLRAAGHGPLVAAADRYAGSFGRATKLAGIEPARPSWNAAGVLTEIRRLHREGVTMNSQQLKTSGHGGLVAAAIKRFGNWRAALAKAKVPAFKRGTWTSWPLIRDRLRALHAEGVRMTSTSMKELGYGDLLEAAFVFAGTWNKALAKAGVPVVEQHRTWTRDDVLDGIRALHRDDALGYGVAIARGQRKLVKAAVARFGSWRAACYVAIPDYKPSLQRWDIPRLLRRIQRRHRNKLSVRSTVVQREEATLTAAARRLGLDWIDACERAGIPASAYEPKSVIRRTRWSHELVLAKLREAAAAGTPLLVKNFSPGFAHAVYRRFDSWADAMTAAGVGSQYARDHAAGMANRLGGVYASKRQRARRVPARSRTTSRRTGR